MCGRFVSATSPEDLARFFQTPLPEVELPPRYNIAPTADIYACVENREKSRRLEVFRWGLVPFWAKDPSVGQRMINARAETLTKRNAYRRAYKNHRCLVPADGFYEWRKPAKGSGLKRKQPYFIHRPDGEPIAMAGLWESWRGPDRDSDEALFTVTLITTDANDELAVIHDRTPAIIEPENFEEWLDPENHDTDSLSELLGPVPPGELEAYPVTPRVGSVRNDGPELIQPWEPDTDPLF